MNRRQQGSLYALACCAARKTDLALELHLAVVPVDAILQVPVTQSSHDQEAAIVKGYTARAKHYLGSAVF